MTTDFTSVVKWFFASVYRYVDRASFSCCKDDADKAVQEVKNIEAKIYDLITERCKSGYNAYVLYGKQYNILAFEYTGLDKVVVDKNVWLAYKQVIERICEYYSVVIPKNARVIQALRLWGCAITVANLKLVFMAKNVKKRLK